MRMKLVASALISLLLISHLLAGESSPGVKLAVAPKYPVLTLAGRICGQVIVRVTIDHTGVVKDTNVVEGHPMLREAAVDAARQWKFNESSIQKRSATLKFNFVILPETSEVGSQTIFLPPMGFEIRQKPEAQPSLEDQGGEFQIDPQPISRT
jgi:TonB family protein